MTDQGRKVADIAELEQLLNVISSLVHDLSQPLTAMTSNAQVANRISMDQSPDLAELRDILHDIDVGADRMGKIVRQIHGILGDRPRLGFSPPSTKPASP